MGDDRQPTVGPIPYRRLDQGSKLLGVALVAVGLEIGGGTAAGIALGAAGAACVLAPLVLAPDEPASDRNDR